MRQRPFHNYIADFMCRSLKLIIEIDGYSHNFKYEKDLERDRIAEELGFKTLRFHDEEVIRDIENVRRSILIEIKTREEEINLF